MRTRFASSLLAAACLAATLGSAHAEGLNLRNLPHGAYAGYELSPSLVAVGGLIEGRTAAVEVGQANPHDSCGSGLSLCPALHKWSVLAPADLADARYALAESELHSRLPAGTGVQYDLGPQVALRLEYQQHPRENALDLKPTVGEVAVAFKVGF